MESNLTLPIRLDGGTAFFRFTSDDRRSELVKSYLVCFVVVFFFFFKMSASIRDADS